jgi:hypothetical protein
MATLVRVRYSDFSVAVGVWRDLAQQDIQSFVRAAADEARSALETGELSETSVLTCSMALCVTRARNWLAERFSIRRETLTKQLHETRVPPAPRGLAELTLESFPEPSDTEGVEIARQLVRELEREPGLVGTGQISS